MFGTLVTALGSLSPAPWQQYHDDPARRNLLDLGLEHPLWTAPVLCPQQAGAAPVRYPGLSFCPPLQFEHMRTKLTLDATPLEWDHKRRVAWNAAPPDLPTVLREYWMIDVASILAVLRGHTELSMWFVNVGAGPSGLAADGNRDLVPEGDDLSMLWHMGYAGVCTDLPEQALRMMRYYQRWTRAILEFRATTPDSLVERLRELYVPKSLDVLKIDVDSFDCEFMEALLNGGFRPKVITLELASSFPPPIRFKMKSQNYPVRATRYTVLQGCSLQYAYDFLRPLGYTLIQYVIEDGWFVLDEFAPLFGVMHNSTLDHYELGNPFLNAKWPWPELSWSIFENRHSPQEMLALVRRSLESVVHLRPGLEVAQYVLEV